MKEIKNVIICGIGAIGSIYANKINNYKDCNLKILVDKTRYQRYTQNPKIFNGEKLVLDYILPDENNFKADLIIISTKYDGLKDTINNIKNFVKEDTIILSLLNGITSEAKIAKIYGWKHIPLAYFIGHSAMRNGNIITHDGTGQIVFGIKDENTDKNDINLIRNFFEKTGINYTIPQDMNRAMWLKYMLNVSTNQPSAILNMTFGQMQNNKKFRDFSIKIMEEVCKIAKASGIKNTDTMIDEALNSFDKMIPEGKTSMLQDIEAKRKTEVEIFANTIIKLGEKYNINTPYNHVLKDMIEIIENNNQKN